jgi:hypothetical protein
VGLQLEPGSREMALGLELVLLLALLLGRLAVRLLEQV